MRKQDIKHILEKFNSGQFTSEDEAIAKYWLHRLNLHKKGKLSDEDLAQADDAMWHYIQANKTPRPHQTKHIWLRVAVAACLVLGLSAGVFYFSGNNDVMQASTAKITSQVLKPGTTGAILTLANGKKVQLGETKVGTTIQQNGANLNKAGDSLLIYNSYNTTGTYGHTDYNILETPFGKQYAVILPDGSKVWLNSGSSLKYPTAFAANERLVELTGEAYFQVVHNSKMPFRVKTAKQVIEDIGTAFNVSAYKDEKDIQTTLVEGIVKITPAASKAYKILKPGQKASNNGSSINIKVVNTDTEVAWKDGLFMFDNTDIYVVMRQIARWYNAEISYDDEALDVGFTGVLPRSSDLKTVLSVLESTRRVKFTIKDNLITVHKR